MNMKNPQNKIDFVILSEYTQKEIQSDGSAVFLKFVEEGEDAVTLRKGYYGSYTLDVSHKVKRLVKFFCVCRSSLNRYILTACEVGVRTDCVLLGSMRAVNEWLRNNFTTRLDAMAAQACGKQAARQ